MTKKSKQKLEYLVWEQKELKVKQKALLTIFKGL